MERTRCSWVTNDILYILYHDVEWGMPLHNERALFELLILEGMQAGLSWITILRKRENFRLAFEGFYPEIVAAFTENKINELMQNEGIVRNRSKIKAAITNAQAFLAVQREFGSFDKYIWHFTDGKQVVGHWEKQSDVPTDTILSDKISKDLKDRGFKYVGSVIVYAYLQAIGVVDDHTANCFKRTEMKQSS